MRQILTRLGCFLASLCGAVYGQIPVTTETWEELSPTGGSKWSARNAHASCSFKDRLWLTGGRSDLHPLYNLINSYKSADVWLSEDGADWAQVSELRGDFYAQNYDALQPGPVAPWYARFAHSLTPLDIDGDGAEDVMILMGGYAPNPINDVWITSDGLTWAFAGYADWSPRAWHGATAFRNSIWVVGGTPITNDVWYASNITYFDYRRAPLTRAMYLEYRYEVKWTKAGDAAWSPRAAMGLVTQYFKPSQDEEGYYRMVLVGGYGGYLDEDRFDGGLRCREDVWVSGDGVSWNRTVEAGPFGGIAFMGIVAWEPNITDPEAAGVTERVWIVGGGYIGETGNRHVLSMQGSVNTYWTQDASDWALVNFVQGGGISNLALYSSNEWARTTINGVIVFLGVWGLTLEVFKPIDPVTGEYVFPNGALHILGGDQVGEGSLLSSVFRGSFGLKCQILGISCSGNGVCSEENLGCICIDGFEGEYCEIGIGVENGAMRLIYSRGLLLLSVIMLILSEQVLSV